MNLLSELFAAWLSAWVYGALAIGLALGAARLGAGRTLWQQEHSWRWVLFAPSLIMLFQLANAPQLGRAALQLVGEVADLDWPVVETAATPSATAPEHGIKRLATEAGAVQLPTNPESERTHVASNMAAIDAVLAAAAHGPALPLESESESRAVWNLQLSPAQIWALSLLVLGLTLGRALRVVADWRHQARRIQSQPLWPDNHLLTELQQLAEQTGSPAPELRQAEDDGGPHAWSPATISLPRWMPNVMTAEQQRAALAHELAHLRRADPRWQLLYALHFALWPLPGAQAVRSKLDQLAERACDDWAAEQTGSRRAMAESLARCAEHYVSTGARFASAMTSKRSPIVARIQHLLKEPLMNASSVSWPLRLMLPASVVAMALLMPALALSPVADAAAADGEAQTGATAESQRFDPPEPPPAPEAPAAPQPQAFEPDSGLAPPAPPTPPAPPAAPSPPAPPSKVSVSKHSWLFGEKTQIELERPGYALKASIDGDFQLNAAETDFMRLDDEADVQEQRDDLRRRLQLSNSQGQIQYTYSVNGAHAPFDAAAKVWWAGVVKQMAREGLLPAKDRVARLLASGGVPEVLTEVEQVNGNYARSSHLIALYKQASLDSASLQRSLALAPAMDSSYELRRLLEVALETQAFAPDSLNMAFKLAQGISSDYEARCFLQAAAKQLPADRASLNSWLVIYKTVSSDYEARVALQSLIENPAMQGKLLEQVVAASETIGSDYERRVALESLAPRINKEPTVVEIYAKAVAGIGSDYEARVAIQSLMEEASLPASTLIALVDAVDSIGSDYERRVALQKIAERMPKDAQLIERIRQSAKPLGSHERGVLEKTLDKVSG